MGVLTTDRLFLAPLSLALVRQRLVAQDFTLDIAEIGYGLGVPGRGCATEAVAALATHLLGSASITVVTATAAVENRASQRVLEKNGFAQIGTSWNEDDRDLLVWRRA